MSRNLFYIHELSLFSLSNMSRFIKNFDTNSNAMSFMFIPSVGSSVFTFISFLRYFFSFLPYFFWVFIMFWSYSNFIPLDFARPATFLIALESAIGAQYSAIWSCMNSKISSYISLLSSFVMRSSKKSFFVSCPSFSNSSKFLTDSACFSSSLNISFISSFVLVRDP